MALLVDKRLPEVLEGTHAYLIGQEDDCGSGVREARRRARGERPCFLRFGVGTLGEPLSICHPDRRQ